MGARSPIPVRAPGVTSQCYSPSGRLGTTSQWVSVGHDGGLAYKALPKGDQIMDFSFAGYMGGGVRIPDVPVQRTVNPSGEDDTSAIQAAIDSVSTITLMNGRRGAVLLGPGVFNCSGSLQLTASGVVLRGSGSGTNGTTIKMTGKPHTAITIHGSGSWQTVGSSASLVDPYVPSGATSFNVDSASGFSAGDAVLITRPTTAAWVHFMGMDKLVRDGKPQTWVSGSIRTDRMIKAVLGNKIKLDVPLSDSFDASLLNPPGGSIAKYNFPGRISQAGVENLRVVALAVDAPIDQAQYQLLSMDSLIDGWARDIAAEDTINSVSVGRAAKQVTLDSVKIDHSIAHSGSAAPADFSVTGTQVFVNRCASKGEGSWYFTTGSQATGPNVVLNFSASGQKAMEPHQRWATGLLLDNCHLPEGGLNLRNRGTGGSGHGWAIGWGVAWNCVTHTLLIQEPPGSENFAIGCAGEPQRASMPGGDGTLLPQGILEAQGTPVLPASLYLSQLCQRLGAQALENIGYSRTPASNAEGPRVFLLDTKLLATSKQRIRTGDRSMAHALAKLVSDAQKALNTGPLSVAHKNSTPPSGDKHDYMSQAPYFWPDPKTPNGLPYVRRDGERNPEINRFPDHQSMDRMVGAVETLALAYTFQGEESYADEAARLLRVWFLEPATRMNPNLEYAQAIPGVNTGRGIGLIETRGLTRIVDAVGLLAGSKAWTEADQRGLEQWFTKFLQWMIESKNGREEAAAKNNHGTYYDLQVASFALFLGKKDLAMNVLQSARQKRIAAQIEPDGRQPLELARTRAWSYSVGNLDGLMLLATLGERVGVDLWNYRTTDGRGIRQALDYLIPFSLGEKKWPHQQLGAWQPEILFPLMLRAAAKYQDAYLAARISKIPQPDGADRSNLLRSVAK